MSLVFEDAPQKVKGEFHIEVRRKGQIVDEFHDHNLVVETGRIRLANLAAGLSDKHITQIGVGTGKEIEAEADTELQDQQLFPLTIVYNILCKL